MRRDEQLTFSEAIEKVLRSHGGYAPLRVIYREFEKFRRFTGKTPLKTIQERVQRDPRFRRIGLGVYALASELGNLPEEKQPRTAPEKQQAEHTRLEGMLIEIGNLDGFETYTPDRGKVFENKKLGAICTLRALPHFTFDSIVASTGYIDVLWMNKRSFPAQAFEIEQSTNFRNALVKFAELQDFRTRFFLVAPAEAKDKYHRELKRAAFASIADRCKFWSSDQVRRLYQSKLELAQITGELNGSSSG